MKTKFLIYSIIIFSCYSGKNENTNISYPEFYRGYNEVKQMIEDDQLDKALIRFDWLCEGIPHIPASNLFIIARACSEKGECKLAAKYLQLSLISGKEYGNAVGRYNTIKACNKEVAMVLKKELDIHKENFNYQYKEIIDSMFQADQEVRSPYDYAKMRIVDSMNMTGLLSLMNSYGYPSAKIIGDKSASYAFIMLLHMDQDENNKVFKPILEKAYNEGYLRPNGLAMIEDRRRNWGKEKLEQYYYTLPSDNYDQFSLEEKDEINRRRDSIGLAPK